MEKPAQRNAWVPEKHKPPPDVLYVYQDARLFTKNMQNIFAFSETGNVNVEQQNRLIAPQVYRIVDRQRTDRKASIFASI